MKIFNTENGVKKVYVQMNDIMMLNQTDMTIPASIYGKVFTDDFLIVDDGNRMDFVEFTQPIEIEFFESMDWIVDYKKIRSLSEKEIKAKGQEISTEMNEIANRFNAMSDEERVENQSLVLRHSLLNYKMQYLAEILWIKQGRQQMPFPVVPDSDGFSFVGNDNCDYQIRASLDPNKLLLFRKDGKKLSGDERIPKVFLQTGISIAVIERSKSDEFFGDYETSNSLAEDGQYLITEFIVKSYESDLEKDKTEEKGIKKFIKRLFNKKA